MVTKVHPHRKLINSSHLGRSVSIFSKLEITAFSKNVFMKLLWLNKHPLQETH